MIRQIQTHSAASLKRVVERIVLTTPTPKRESLARAICIETLKSIWMQKCSQYQLNWAFKNPVTNAKIDRREKLIADEMGFAVAELNSEQLCIALGSIYTSLLPEKTRAKFGVYYTPQVLVDTLLKNVENENFDFAKSKILDPACGCGIFLLSIVKKIRSDLKKRFRKFENGFIKAVSGNIRGYEIDPFAAWMAQTFLELETFDECAKIGRRISTLIFEKDSLLVTVDIGSKFDLIIGNPPYGRVSLSADQREKFSGSLYGHANLYGIFTDLALQISKNDALIAFVTPTSFLSGQYFKFLRELLAKTAPPVSIDFVSNRSGVFEGVLQETLLVVFSKTKPKQATTIVSELIPIDAPRSVQKFIVGSFSIPVGSESPWLFPRSRNQVQFVSAALQFSSRLEDYGYEVVTGQLVWNRHKNQLSPSAGRGKVPLIWAESISPSGVFTHRATRKNHTPFFSLKSRQEFLITNQECVLIQRTTSKEQARRLIAAVMPDEFLSKHKSGVVVENHLNIIRPVNGNPKVSVHLLAALLNSKSVDNVFRCISGSVAVSAYELNNLPLPNPSVVASLATDADVKLKSISTTKKIENLFEKIK